MSQVVKIRADIKDDAQNVRRDFLDTRIWGNDDNVVLYNILDGKEGRILGEFLFSYDDFKMLINPGQTFRLPGYQAGLFVKHMASYCYRHLDKKPDMDKIAYPRDDKWVQKIVVEVQKAPSMAREDRETIQQLPDYIHQDAQVDPESGLPGRLQGAMSQAGGGEHEMTPVSQEDSATDSDIDKIPDFDAKLNPRQGVEANKVNAPKSEEQAFPGANRSEGESKKTTRQSKK